MPFQVSLCSAAYTPATFTVVMTNSPFISPCVTELTLTATVVTGYVGIHTFLWELYSGSPVDFTSPTDGLIATCTLVDSSDRIFYFWIDKGTPLEIRQSYIYNGTPTDIPSTDCGNIMPLISQDILNGSITCSSIIGTQIVSTGIATVNPNNVVLYWQLPTTYDDLQLMHYLYPYTVITMQLVEVQQVINGNWVTVLSILPTDPQILTTATLGAYYRVVITYKVNNALYKQYSCPYPLIIDISNYNVYAADDLGRGCGNIMPQPTIINSTLISSDSFTDEIHDAPLIFNGNIMPLPTIINYTLVNSDSFTNEIRDDITIFGGNIMPRPTIVYFGGTIIGSV